MPHKRGHHDIGCEQLFCFDLACNFHRMLILQSSSEQGMNEPYKCLRCGQTQCSHTPPDLPDLVDSTPSPPRLYPRLPSAPPAELSDDSSVESVEESLRTTDAERAGTIPANPFATAMAMAGARAQAKPYGRARSSPKKKRQTGKPATTCSNGSAVNRYSDSHDIISPYIKTR